MSPAIAGNGTYSFAIKNSSSDLASYSSKEGAEAPELVLTTGLTKQTADSEGIPPDAETDRNEPPLPKEITLYPNYPNPFNPETTFCYALPEAAKVKLSIYNLRGQLVRVMVDAVQKAGTKKILWNGKDAHNKAVSAGVYFMRLSVGANKFTQKITLQK